MDIDRRVMEELQHSTPEQRQALMNFLDASKRKPENLLIMAIFRDIVVFKDMAAAKIMVQDAKIRSLEKEIEQLHFIVRQLIPPFDGTGKTTKGVSKRKQDR